MSKRVVVPLLFLIALCLLIGYLSWKSESVPSTTPFSSIKESDVQKIAVDIPGSHILLQTNGGKWTLSSPVADAADPSACTELLKDVIDMSVSSELAEDPSSYPQYDLSLSSASRVRLYGHGSTAPLLDAYFGKTAVGFNSVYMRWTNSRPVYMASGISRFVVAKGPNDYRLRDIFALNADKAQRIRVAQGPRSYEIQKSSSGWVFISPKLPDFKAAVLASTIYGMHVADFPAQPLSAKQSGFSKPTLVITVSGPSGSSSCLVGRKKIEGGKQKPYYYYAQADWRQAPLLLSVYDIDSILDALKFVKSH